MTRALTVRSNLTPEQHADLQVVISAVMHAAQEKIDRRETLTQFEHDVLCAAERSHRWLASKSDEFVAKWRKLPAGSHLREAYADMVWTWSDEDLYCDPA